MGEVAAYFDLDGTLLDASSEKTLTATLLRRRPWRFPVGLTSWSVRAVVNLLRGGRPTMPCATAGTSPARRGPPGNALRGAGRADAHAARAPSGAGSARVAPRSGPPLHLVTATVAPMAEAMGKQLGMDAVYGCGPAARSAGFPALRRAGPCREERKGARGESGCGSQRARFGPMLGLRQHPRRQLVHARVRACHCRQPRRGAGQGAEARGWEQVQWRVD